MDLPTVVQRFFDIPSDIDLDNVILLLRVAAAPT